MGQGDHRGMHRRGNSSDDSATLSGRDNAPSCSPSIAAIRLAHRRGRSVRLATSCYLRCCGALLRDVVYHLSFQSPFPSYGSRGLKGRSATEISLQNLCKKSAKTLKSIEKTLQISAKSSQNHRKSLICKAPLSPRPKRLILWFFAKNSDRNPPLEHELRRPF